MQAHHVLPTVASPQAARTTAKHWYDKCAFTTTHTMMNMRAIIVLGLLLCLSQTNSFTIQHRVLVLTLPQFESTEVLEDLVSAYGRLIITPESVHACSCMLTQQVYSPTNSLACPRLHQGCLTTCFLGPVTSTGRVSSTLVTKSLQSTPPCSCTLNWTRRGP
jgi:hypothetical protein